MIKHYKSSLFFCPSSARLALPFARTLAHWLKAKFSWPNFHLHAIWGMPNDFVRFIEHRCSPNSIIIESLIRLIADQ